MESRVSTIKRVVKHGTQVNVSLRRVCIHAEGTEKFVAYYSKYVVGVIRHSRYTFVDLTHPFECKYFYIPDEAQLCILVTHSGDLGYYTLGDEEFFVTREEQAVIEQNVSILKRVK